MATLVAFHAHPDDEAIATGGAMLLASRAGHRVILVLATRGEVGEVDEGFLADGETLADRRTVETLAAAELLGVHRVEFLGYHDSGMAGQDTNRADHCFWRADVNEAALRLHDLLVDESVDVLTCYDSNGGYGHPDHIQVHRVGHRFAELAGVSRVYESTMNRTQIQEQMAMIVEQSPEMAEEFEDVDDNFGSPDEVITTAVDVTSVIDDKRRAMAAHASQIDENSFFLAMAPEVFSAAFGTEWYIRTDTTPKEREVSLFGGNEG
ncbi:MAG: GlcNAc-PI de-N-acetylase [Actinomycetia bacterium]|nr:GlcNAc-PI de-N-acetylase [Actinomycetes bacterium]MCP4963536.1 GlcNAc-PI de-N-acetylase [Actinomycetes bacterium]